LLFLLEIKIISYGLLTVGGIVSMLLGSLILFKSTPSVAAHLPFHLIISVTIASSLFFIFAILMAIRTHHKKISTGKEGMKDEIGIAISDIAPDGQVKIHGEYWTATSTEKINKNEKIRVLAVEGLQLIVEKFQK